MSLPFNSTRHDYYMGYAIVRIDLIADPQDRQHYWLGCTEVHALESSTLKELKQLIREYRGRS